MDYTWYEPKKPHHRIFEIPDVCQDAEQAHVPFHLKWQSRVPQVKYAGHKEYDAFLLTQNPSRRHSSMEEYNKRVSVFVNNKNMIEMHNANPLRSFSMKMNRFGDWTREEFLNIMLPNHYRKDSSSTANEVDPHEIPYEAKVHPSMVPEAVDWRGTPAGGKVKDQANCGSCWAFGAVGSMEAAWNLYTGETLQLSEQQVMDCSWGYVPKREGAASACNGGDAYVGISHIIDAGGIVNSSNYNYLGIGDYCKEKKLSKAAKFLGFSRVPRYDDDALMEALYSRGPLAVSMDASQDSFTFYSSGVYQESKCMWRVDDLDHSMMLVGYGTDPDHGPYWLIKNSWSKHWGDEGYIKISRSGHGCGASSDAVYAIVDTD